VVEEEVDEVPADDASDERPGGERVERGRIEALVAGAAHEQDRSEINTGRGQHPE
jgi:hypothetical protein